MSAPDINTLWHIAERMAEDIQEYVDAGAEGGSHMAASRQLLEEFETLRRASGRHWLDEVGTAETADALEAL